LIVRRGLYWVGVLLAVLLAVVGVVVAALGYAETSSPAGVVRGYFAALARADAAEALAYGTVPVGPHTLLTDTVLQEQQRIAPLRHFAVVSTHRHGTKAEVAVKYALGFPGEDVPVSVSVPVHKRSGVWRLDYVAIPAQLELDGARERASIVGAAVPSGTMLLFPGALPIRLDTPYLKLDPFKDAISFDTSSVVEVALLVTDGGRSAMERAVRTALRGCVSYPSDPACPLPNERYVPGSVQGSIAGGLRTSEVVLDASEPVGTLRFEGSVTVSGRWRRLNFHNVQVTGHGDVDLDIHAVAYAVPPIRLRWMPA
jgi:hypothetical protein